MHKSHKRLSTPEENAILQPMVLTILRHLRDAGSITNVEAQAVHRCRALPRRISDLEREGYEIRRENCKDTTGQRYVRYHLVE